MSNTTTTTTTTTPTNATINTKTLTAQSVALSVSAHSANHGDFTRLIRALSAATTGRAKIEAAAFILLTEQRELLAVKKQFESFEHYATALKDRVEAKQAGAKNELKNASGIKAGNKDVCNFYSLINTALKGESKLDKETNKLERFGCASSHAPDGYKLAFDLESEKFTVEKFVKKAPVKAGSLSEVTPNETKVETSDNADNSPKTKVSVETAPVFSLSNALEQIMHLSIEDMQTLSSALVNATDDKLVTVCSAIEHALEIKQARQAKAQDHDLQLVNLEMKAAKASKELMSAKADESVKPSIVKRLAEVSKNANLALVDCKNTMTLEARQY